MKIFVWVTVVSESNTRFGTRKFKAQSGWISNRAVWKRAAEVPQGRRGAALSSNPWCFPALKEIVRSAARKAGTLCSFGAFTGFICISGPTSTLWDDILHVGANCVYFPVFLRNPDLGFFCTCEWNPVVLLDQHSMRSHLPHTTM